jgi:hypothetical protein
MKLIRTRDSTLHATPDQPYPLHSGAPLTNMVAARLAARPLARQGEGGWMIRVQEMRQADWPDDHGMIDQSVEKAIGWLEPCSVWRQRLSH